MVGWLCLTLGFESGEQFLVERIHPLPIRFTSLTILVRLARSVVQVPLTGNLRVLQAVGPAAELPRNGLATGLQSGDLVLDFLEVNASLHDP